MKATGIVRLIDDLGRIVIPKEIRKTLHLREGDPMELYIDEEGGIVLRPYSAFGNYDRLLKCLSVALKTAKYNTGVDFFVTDNFSVLESTARGTFVGESISEALRDAIERGSIVEDSSIKLVRTPKDDYQVQYVYPLIRGGDVYGSICASYSDANSKAFEEQKNLIRFTAEILVENACR